MNNKIRSGLYFGICITMVFLIKDSFSWLMGEASSKEIIKSIIAAVFTGLFSGIVAGWLTDRYLVNNLFTKAPKFDLENGETIHFQTPANHFKEVEAVGGFICLTDKRLLFKSHNLNIQKHELSILLSDITAVDRYKPLGLIDNGIALKLSNHATEKFVVEKTKQLIEHIARTKNVIQV